MQNHVSSHLLSISRKRLSPLIFVLLSSVLFLAISQLVVGAQQPAPPDTTLPPAIVSFSADLSAVTMTALEKREAKTNLSWVVVNLPPDDKIVLQIYQRNEWGDVFPDEPLTGNEEREIIVEPPLNFGPPTYRLAVVNADGDMVEERVLTIPYDMEQMADLVPSVISFGTGDTELDAGAVASREARLPVFWNIQDRLPNSNVVFEQQMEDGTFIPVELARPFLWLPSDGEGVIAPVLPQQLEDPVRLRMRVMDVVSGETYATSELVLPLVGAAVTAVPMVNTRVPSIPVTPPPGQTIGCTTSPLDVPFIGYPGDGCNVYADAGASVQINSFTMTNQEVVEAVRMAHPRSDLLSFTWNVSGADKVLVEIYDRNLLRSGLPVTPYMMVDDMPAIGGNNFFVSGMTEGARIILWAYLPGSGQTPYRRVAYAIWDVPFLLTMASQNCEIPKFNQPDPQGCPQLTAVTTMPAAYQPFERGFMLWRGDIGMIFVFSKDGYYYIFPSEQYSGLPDNPITDTPPDGRSLPTSGFGKVWGSSANIRDLVGWALGGEQSYTMTFQATQGSGYMYFQLPGGQVAQVFTTGSNWNYETQ